jgi:hypothetical protein
VQVWRADTELRTFYSPCSFPHISSLCAYCSGLRFGSRILPVVLFAALRHTARVGLAVLNAWSSSYLPLPTFDLTGSPVHPCRMAKQMQWTGRSARQAHACRVLWPGIRECDAVLCCRANSSGQPAYIYVFVSLRGSRTLLPLSSASYTPAWPKD